MKPAATRTVKTIRPHDASTERDMEIIGNRKYVNVPGGKTHELPPLLLKERIAPAGA